MTRSLRWGLAAAGALVLIAVVVLLAAERRDHGDRVEEPMAEMSGTPAPGMRLEGDRTVSIPPEMERSLGITMATVELSPVHREIRTSGHVTYDERRQSTISLKFDGFVERLHVDVTGQLVRRGQPLLEIYAPELVSAQEELLSAVRLEGELAYSAAPGVAERTSGLADAARRRLLLWDISPGQIAQIERTGTVRRTLTVHAPFAGFVVEKNVQRGQSVRAGEALYYLADLSRIWIEADIFEQDLRLVRLGESMDVEIAAYPAERFKGNVSYIYPDVNRDTRTARVRLELSNPGARIKPGMFATLTVSAPVSGPALLVPREAVIRTGARDVVFVQQRPGVFELRDVRAGNEAGARIEILSGLIAGERVVARANFLMDAETRLMETMIGQPGTPGIEGMDSGGMQMDMPGMPH